MSQTGSPSLWNQSTRILALTASVLAGQNTALTEIDGVDEISKPFLFKIKFVTMAPPETVRTMLRTEVTIEFGAPGQGGSSAPSRRKVRGLVRRVTRTAVGEHGAGTSDWEAEVVAPLWFLSLKSDVRIYQNVSLGEIITSALQSAGLPAPTINASGFASHKFDYCVQHNETTLDFISRLMEKFGWFYYYEHGDSASTLVISDANAQVAAPDPTPLQFGAPPGSASMVSLEEDYSVSPGKWTARDFDYKAFAHEERGHPTVLQSGGVLT